MKLTKIERVMLLNQFTILAILDADNASIYSNKVEIVANGYEGFYDEIFDNISDGISVDICNETREILKMYRVINSFVSKAKSEDVNNVKLDLIKFDGFDANEGEHYIVMEYLVEKANLYSEYQNTDFNSHSMASLMRYRKMLPVFKRVYEDNDSKLNVDGLYSIVRAIL